MGGKAASCKVKLWRTGSLGLSSCSALNKLMGGVV